MGRPVRRRKRHRGLTALLVVLIVLAAAFFIGDQYARSYAQNMIASKVQSSSKLANKPAVSIKGWPFLTQVASRDVKAVDIRTGSVQEQGLDIASINATANDVRINSHYNGATIGTVNGDAVISYSSLAAKSGVKGLSLSQDPSGGPNDAKITLSSLADVMPASVAQFLPKGPVSGVAKITQSGPSAVSVQAVSFGKIPLSQLGSIGDFTVKIPQLPMGMSVSGLSLTPQGAGVQVTAHDVTLGGGGLGGSGLGG
jgi:hypothetical protein